MKMKMMILVLLGIFLLSCSGFSSVSAASSAKKMTTKEVVEKILHTKLVPTYAEIEANSTGSGHTGMTIKAWDNTIKGQFRTEEKIGDTISYSVSSGKKTITYTKGENQAIEYNAGTTVSLNDAKPVLKEMQETTVLTFVGVEKLLNRSVYHLKGKGKTETITINNRGQSDSFKHTYPDREIWIDTKTGFVMKDTERDTRLSIERFKEVVKVDFAPKFSAATFKLTLPKNVTIVNADDLKPKQ
ncbi:hypothetical protein SD71_10195 [Cohnella kolymensis]|uniref:Uncharacterized protein n=1 Tax=Cohnella kolymensis TaxID=1590652 RepID=A0ABR5A3Z7_9BACL|nr:hypothetical protein [Cohnella kolymensis]KIL35777.1 hypothetical protein SD71_10195 [Cohnella kolymensis]